MGLPAGVRAAPRLGPAERITSRRDFDRLRRQGRRGGDNHLRVLLVPNGLAWSRVASAVPRRYGNAVARNLLRRRFRDAFRHEKGALPRGYDLLLSPARESKTASLEDLRASLVRCVTKVAGRLERASAEAGEQA
jgi:ribonuclease P protein component